MGKKEYVFVTYDPLLEEVICVHRKQDSWCDKCKKLYDQRIKDDNYAYLPYSIKRLVKD
jgi:hypothetical protein